MMVWWHSLEDTSLVCNGSGNSNVNAAEGSYINASVSALAGGVAVTLSLASLEDLLSLVETGEVD